jgi:hypothetical protein
MVGWQRYLVVRQFDDGWMTTLFSCSAVWRWLDGWQCYLVVQQKHIYCLLNSHRHITTKSSIAFAWCIIYYSWIWKWALFFSKTTKHVFSDTIKCLNYTKGSPILYHLQYHSSTRNSRYENGKKSPKKKTHIHLFPNTALHMINKIIMLHDPTWLKQSLQL